MLALALALFTVASLAGGSALAQSGVAFREHYFSDTPGAEAYYADVLGAIGVVRGEQGAGGFFRPADPVTRAEFAVMVARLLALESGFEPASSTVPAFRDSADIPPWATEAVATCFSLGIIGGVPSERGGVEFRPKSEVSGAEATAMLLRALGNADAVTGGWPAGYIFRASETGLYAADMGVGDWRMLSPLVPITRAQMGYLLHNALFSQRGYEPAGGTTPGTFSRPSIGSSLASYVMVVGADLMARSLMGTGERSVRLAGMVVADRVSEERDLVGHRFFLLENSRSQVVYLRRYANEVTVTGSLGSMNVRPGGAGVASLALTDGQTIPCRADAVIELNARHWPFPPEIILPTAQVTAFLEEGQAVYVSILQEDLQAVVLKVLSFSATADGERVTGRISMGPPEAVNSIPVTVDARSEIYLNGKPASMTDLRERDICYVATEGAVPKRALRVYAYRNRIVGEVQEVYRRYTGESGFWEADVLADDGSTRTVTFAESCSGQVDVGLVGRRLAFCLNREGQAAYFSFIGPTPGHAVVAKIVTVWDLPSLRLLTVDYRSERLTFSLPAPVARPVPGSLQVINVSPDGSVTGLYPVRPAMFMAKVKSVDEAKCRLGLSSEYGDWVVDVTDVPLYRTDPIIGLINGDLGHLRPGEPVWLDDPGAPSYAISGQQAS